MRPFYRTLFSLILFAILLPRSSPCSEDRPPERGGKVKSLGLPRRIKPYAGVEWGFYRPTQDNWGFCGRMNAGFYVDILNPAISILGFRTEGYWGNRDTKMDGGLRSMLDMPHFHFSAGVDFNIRDRETDFILMMSHPLVRGGLFDLGGNVYADWLPGRDNTVHFGLTVPLGQRNLGKTRTQQAFVKFHNPPVTPVHLENRQPALDDALSNISVHIKWINILTVPFSDQNGFHTGGIKKYEEKLDEMKSHLAHRSFNDDIDDYHSELSRAFSIAITGLPYGRGESIFLGREICAKAREIILREVIFPYNRLLGQRKRHDSTREFASYAKGSFVRWLHTSSAVTPECIESVRYVFWRLLDLIEENRKFSAKECNDGRIVWIPLQYALRPEQHDSQQEMDDLIAEASGEQFTEGNWIWYIVNEQFQYELTKMILEAKDYHILWIHDIRGKTPDGDPDALSFYQIKNGWLKALTESVRRYDETGKIPTYMIFLDQFFYEVNKSRFWMKLLQDPLTCDLDFPEEFKWMEDEIEKAQDDLRQAVADSKLLQQETSQYGEDWLKNLIKINVNITNPSDPSFFTGQILPLVGFPDNFIRDHRKISFFDITEDDPYRGRAIYTGMGVGEHYAGATWEDRAIMAVGPALLSLKKDARQLLLNHGFKPEEIPWPLRAGEKPSSYQARIDSFIETTSEGATSRFEMHSKAVQLHNQTGYNPKPINVMRAVTWSLMPPGSVFKIPDSLWNSSFYASILMGSSLRGCRVYVIAPSLSCAPSNGFPQMARAHEMLTRLVIFQQKMAAELEICRGEFRTGLYDPQVAVGDLMGRINAIRKSFRDNPFLMELYNFDRDVPLLVESIDSMLATTGQEVNYLVDDPALSRPALHMKSGFFASREGWDGLMSRPEWLDLYREYTIHRVSQLSDQLEAGSDDLPRALVDIGVPMLRSFLEDLTPEEREKVIYYLHVGSANMNFRSMIQDGEVMFVVSGLQSIFALIDFIELMGLTTWVDDQETLDSLLPPPSNFKRLIGRMIKIMV
ncbi:MAG: hypothetical protein KOO63_04300 [Bacteroidales bacterium]|nr:hypothetical protein [Candidatus Latescibacterota bacterium]